LRLVAGKLALLLAFVYLLVLVAALVDVARGDGIPVVGYVLLLLPGGAFVMASRDAITLHRASDVGLEKAALKRCASYAGLGLAILAAVGVAVDRITG
jgi:hypothetical protein